MKKTYLNWSSGKDAAFALYKLQREKEFSVEKLVTTLNADVNRISMHGVRKELLAQQAESLNLPLQCVQLPGNVSMEMYNDLMERETKKLVSEGFTHSAFGDIFLEDLKQYRENQLANIGLKAVFPLWKQNTAGLVREFLGAGFKAVTVCVNAKVLDKSFCGRIIDDDFLRALPKNVDPCGEHGEFHSFVFDGPNFKFPIAFEKGELVAKSYQPQKKDGDNCFSDKKESWDTQFWYCDLGSVNRLIRD